MKYFALCEGRHEIPDAVDGAIFPQQLDPTDLKGMADIVATRLSDAAAVTLYVTGLSVALVEVIKYCQANGIGLTLMHFNRDTGCYYKQSAVVVTRCPFCGHLHNPTDWYCPNCGAT